MNEELKARASAWLNEDPDHDDFIPVPMPVVELVHQLLAALERAEA